ncbi:MAG: NfeD family protein [Bacteroidota bacterium]
MMSTLTTTTWGLRRPLGAILLLALWMPSLVQAAPVSDPLAFEEPLGNGPVYVVPVEGLIDSALANYIERAIADAQEGGAALIIFHIDTFGGLVDAADQIRKAVLDAPIPTLAFIDKNAASAGALISYAADRIVMVPGASIGAATVVEGGSGEQAPDKYQSYMRGLMRATAEANGRDPQIAEAMVDENLAVDGVSEAGQVLTLSAAEARRLGVSDATLPTLEAVAAGVDLETPSFVQHRASRAELILRFFASPVIQSLLMLMMLGGLYFELQTPGVGFAGGMALIGAACFFAPHYLLGLAASWEIALFVIGVLLIMVEIFILPGFGVAGAGGIILVVGSLIASLIGNVDLSFPALPSITPAMGTVAFTLVLLVLLIFSVGRYLPKSDRFNKLVLQPGLSSAEGFTSADTALELVGLVGTALTPLRPSGTADLDGRRTDVITRGEFIDSGTPVKVVNVRGSRVEVRPLEALSETSAS